MGPDRSEETELSAPRGQTWALPLPLLREQARGLYPPSPRPAHGRGPGAAIATRSCWLGPSGDEEPSPKAPHILVLSALQRSIWCCLTLHTAEMSPQHSLATGPAWDRLQPGSSPTPPALGHGWPHYWAFCSPDLLSHLGPVTMMPHLLALVGWRGTSMGLRLAQIWVRSPALPLTEINDVGGRIRTEKWSGMLPSGAAPFPAPLTAPPARNTALGDCARPMLPA